MKVIKALTRKMELEEGLIDKLPALMEDHILSRHPGAALTGADMYGWASAAYLAGLKRTVTELIADGYVAGSLPEGEAPRHVQLLRERPAGAQDLGAVPLAAPPGPN